MIFEILLYETENGESQVTDFIRKLPRQSRAKLYQITSVMKEKGPEIRMPYSYPGGRNIVLTNGFRKTTQKTPKSGSELPTLKKSGLPASAPAACSGKPAQVLR